MPPSDSPSGIFRCPDCAVFGSTGDGILVTDFSGNIVEVNAAFCAITGYGKAEVLGRNPRIMKSDRHDAAFYARMWKSLVEQGQWQGEVWDRRKNGETFPKWLTINTVRDSAGRATGYVGIFSDLTGAKRTEAELERLAHYDSLTGLPNRILFRDRLAQALAQAQRGRRRLALLFLDLDGFKAVNDSRGHAAGDAVLQQVAQRLAASVRASDTLARQSGDEFTILLTEIDSANDAAIVARKLLDAMNEPFEVLGRSGRLSASIGIAMSPEDAEHPEELLANADTAMYRAKESGRNRYQFFSRSMHARAVAQIELEAELRQAVPRGELVLHYQPQIEPSRARIVGVEALVRWNHPRLGLLAPARFIPLAEETRLIGAVGDWVVHAACRQARAWRDAGLPLVRVAVNLAPQQFEDPKLVDRIAAWLIESRVDPSQLEVEITESNAMANPDRTVERLLELKAIGIHVSIDDFGTGHSSLSYLKRFPVESLKIDRGFLRDVPDDQDSATLCSAMIGLAHSLGLSVVAEGVETAAQYDFLRDRECDLLQGFLFSRPVPPERLAELLSGPASLAPEPPAPRITPPKHARLATPPGRSRLPTSTGRSRIPTEPGRQRIATEPGRQRVTTRRARSIPPPRKPNEDRRREK
jgi:diguanylate cyclase (GGDEF)-like protein/PAS domain S-box-containing protein